MTIDGLSYFISGVLFCPPQMHILMKVILYNSSPIEYCDIITDKCLELIQSNMNDWNTGYSNVHCECFNGIVAYMVYKSVLTNREYTTRSEIG